jgi:hypothetical protein
MPRISALDEYLVSGMEPGLFQGGARRRRATDPARHTVV